MAKPATPGPCSDCGEQQRKLSRGRCPKCYTRWWKAQKKGGTFVRLEPASLLDRLQSKMSPQANGCIHWSGSINVHGYGWLSFHQATLLAHRTVYEALRGPIPDGFQIDHTCHNGDMSCPGGETCMHRRCVNPDHLEAVTPRQNQRRSHATVSGKHAAKTECVNGHAFTPENIYWRPDDGTRACRQCGRERRDRSKGGPPPESVREYCRNGHRMTEDNTYIYGRLAQCRACKREARTRRKAARREAEPGDEQLPR